jgi:hypothetical protein
MPGDGFVTSGQWKMRGAAYARPKDPARPLVRRPGLGGRPAATVRDAVFFSPRGPRAAGGGVRRGRADPIAIMLGSAELLRAWVLGTLAGLADDNEHHARLRETLLVFLRTGGFIRRLPGS